MTRIFRQVYYFREKLGVNPLSEEVCGMLFISVDQILVFAGNILAGKNVKKKFGGKYFGGKYFGGKKFVGKIWREILRRENFGGKYFG